MLASKMFAAFSCQISLGGYQNNARQCFMTTFCSKLDIIIGSSERIRGIQNKKDHQKKLKFKQHLFFTS